MYNPQIPFCLAQNSCQARVYQKDCQKDGVNNGQTGEKLGEGGDDIVAGEDYAGQAVGENTQDTNTGETDALTSYKTYYNIIIHRTTWLTENS